MGFEDHPPSLFSEVTVYQQPQFCKSIFARYNTHMPNASVNKSKFFFWAIVIAILNPIFSGMILGLFMRSQPDLKKEGRTVLLFSVAWGILALLLVAKFKNTLLYGG